MKNSCIEDHGVKELKRSRTKIQLEIKRKRLHDKLAEKISIFTIKFFIHYCLLKGENQVYLYIIF